MIKPYIQIIKPGIICGNLIPLTGGFVLACQGDINYNLLFSTIIGVAFVIASSCICNNYIDRDIDKKTKRTQNRALVKGTISPKWSLFYASILGSTGIIILYFYVNLLAMLVAIIGFIIYVCIYSLYMKRSSIHGTLIGSLSGATPPIIGYLSVTNHVEPIVLILLIIFSLWQMPHSYAIAIFRLKDYKSAHIPVLPVIKGVLITKNHIVWYIVAFTFATILLTIFGYTGYQYLLIMLATNIWWLKIALSGYKNKNDQVWSRKLFFVSIIIIIIISIMMSIDRTNNHLQNDFIF
ncbi:heme o synthase [Candidatus Erwinia haradaeae]|uniref:Protoheme IX farnesyltransferase n=1 Tax=Candidatus Erwinia haradaeae TaxID=1922217 RepID=A0A451D3A0_9GAMM|nr:heme o synthase [Candidatus Erwinia haradaeae]VFP80135.1 Protoheme IX farnesyltransferase [Candidatus Erwinia haradaeae]